MSKNRFSRTFDSMGRSGKAITVEDARAGYYEKGAAIFVRIESSSGRSVSVYISEEDAKVIANLALMGCKDPND